MDTSNYHVIYQNVVDVLDCQHRSAFPAEFHGYMCGIICGGNYTENEAGFRMVIDMLQDEGLLSTGSKEIAAKLMLGTFHQLHDMNCDFKLFLPDDDQSINLRSQALAAWCQNFLSGLGLSGINNKKLQQDDINEAIFDIVEIAKLKCDDLLDEKDEHDEMEFMQLVEYVRVVALLIYTENIVPNNQAIEIRH
jgi:uncharacterized protein YgfB (UPF0149 family)